MEVTQNTKTKGRDEMTDEYRPDLEVEFHQDGQCHAELCPICDKSRTSRLDSIRQLVLNNQMAGRPTFEGMKSSEIAAYNRAAMFGDNDEAFPDQNEWSRITD